MSAPMTIPTCATCRAYLPGHKPGGLCMRHPPQILAIDRGRAGGPTIESFHPWVTSSAGCFDHIPAEPPLPKPEREPGWYPVQSDIGRDPFCLWWNGYAWMNSDRAAAFRWSKQSLTVLGPRFCRRIPEEPLP